MKADFAVWNHRKRGYEFLSSGLEPKKIQEIFEHDLHVQELGNPINVLHEVQKFIEIKYKFDTNIAGVSFIKKEYIPKSQLSIMYILSTLLFSN